MPPIPIPGLAVYLLPGWIGLASGIALGRRFGLCFIMPLLAGAAAYTLGAAVDFVGLPAPVPGIVGAHELFHVGVLAGIAAHRRFIAGIGAGSPVYAPHGAGYNRAPAPRRPAP